MSKSDSDIDQSIEMKERLQQEQREKLARTQKQLDELKEQLETLTKHFEHSDSDHYSQQIKEKMAKFKQKEEKEWQRMKSKLQDENSRKEYLEHLATEEQNELDDLKSQYLELLKDLERAEKIKDYLTGRKRELFVLQRLHQKERGTLTSQNFKLDKVFMENRALRQKELRRMALDPEDGCEDVILEGRAFQMKKRIDKMHAENAKLKQRLNQL